MKLIIREAHKKCLKRKRLTLFLLLSFMSLVIIVKYTIGLENDHVAQSASDCLFCKIANGKKATVFEYETDEFAIFKDISPASNHHFLAVPKKHYESLKVLNNSHIGLVNRMQDAMLQLLQSKGIDTENLVIGFHIPPFISQKHLHLHGISPASEMSLWNRINFFLPSFWFKSANDSINYLRSTEI